MIAFVPLDAVPDDLGRVCYEVTRGGDRLGYVLLPPDVVAAIDAGLSLALVIHAALHPEVSP